MAWTAPNHYLNQCWNIVKWTLRNKLQWNFSRNTNIFFKKNALENVVCVIASISSRPQWVKTLRPQCSEAISLSVSVHKQSIMQNRLSRHSFIFTLRPRQNGRHFADDISKLIFLYENCCILYSNLTELCSYGSNCSKLSIALSNSLAQNRWQAITWTNVDQDPCTATWYPMATLSYLEQFWYV